MLQALGQKTNCKKDDEILITTMEHHSNIVPWQMLCEKLGAKLAVCPINTAGEILMDEFLKKLIVIELNLLR